MEVMPWQVVVGFLESVRARRDSGVCEMKGIGVVLLGVLVGRNQWTRESKVDLVIVEVVGSRSRRDIDSCDEERR